MSPEKLAYHDVDKEALGLELESLIEPFGEDGLIYSKSTSQNVIILAGHDSVGEGLEATIQCLSEIIPGRFFVLIESEEDSELQLRLAAKCYRLPDGEHLCSEIIKIAFPSKSFGAVPSIVLAHALTATGTYLFLADALAAEENIQKVAAYSDEIIFDSEDYSRRTEILSGLLSLNKRLIDLSWVHAGVWRQELKGVFELPGLVDQLPKVAQVTLLYGTEGEIPPPETLLVAGWILDRLQVELAGVSGSTYSCEGRLPLKLELRRDPTSPVNGLLRICFLVSEDNQPEQELLRVERGEGGEIVTLVGRSYKVTGRFPEKDATSCIQRHFFVGEAVRHYPAALRQMLELCRMSSEPFQTGMGE